MISTRGPLPATSIQVRVWMRPEKQFSLFEWCLSNNWATLLPMIQKGMWRLASVKVWDLNLYCFLHIKLRFVFLHSMMTANWPILHRCPCGHQWFSVLWQRGNWRGPSFVWGEDEDKNDVPGMRNSDCGSQNCPSAVFVFRWTYSTVYSEQVCTRVFMCLSVCMMQPASSHATSQENRMMQKKGVCKIKNSYFKVIINLFGKVRFLQCSLISVFQELRLIFNILLSLAVLS